jgi:hypothetical protein
VLGSSNFTNGLAELNAAIGELLRQFNNGRPLRRLGVTRRTLLEELGCPPRLIASPNGACAASALITISRSTPIFTASRTRFARNQVEVRLTPQTVEIFLKGERIAAHRRGSGHRGHTTLDEHMPSSHRHYAD